MSRPYTFIDHLKIVWKSMAFVIAGLALLLGVALLMGN